MAPKYSSGSDSGTFSPFSGIKTFLNFELTAKVYCLLKPGCPYSKRRFAENQAEEWWRENQERVFKKYSHPTQSAHGNTTSSHEDEHHP